MIVEKFNEVIHSLEKNNLGLEIVVAGAIGLATINTSLCRNQIDLLAYYKSKEDNSIREYKLCVPEYFDVPVFMTVKPISKLIDDLQSYDVNLLQMTATQLFGDAEILKILKQYMTCESSSLSYAESFLTAAIQVISKEGEVTALETVTALTYLDIAQDEFPYDLLNAIHTGDSYMNMHTCEKALNEGHQELLSGIKQELSYLKDRGIIADISKQAAMLRSLDSKEREELKDRLCSIISA